MRVMDQLGAHTDHSGPEEFGLNCRNLNLENVFVDESDHTQIVCPTVVSLTWRSLTVFSHRGVSLIES